MKLLAGLLAVAALLGCPLLGCSSSKVVGGTAGSAGPAGATGSGGTVGAAGGSGGSGTGARGGGSGAGVGGAAGAGGGSGSAGTGGGGAGTSGTGGAAGAAGSVGGGGGSGTAGEPGAFCTSAWCWSNPLPQGEPIMAIWADRGGTVIAGGFGGALMRWNGSAWESITSDLIGDVDAIWGSGPNDVWVSSGMVLFRFDGKSLRQVASPPPPVGGSAPYFYSISGTGPDDVWFGSYEGVYHWTAGGWEATVYLAGQQITFISAASSSEVWAMGDHLYRWSGTTFAEVTWPRTNPLFEGVFAFASDDVWVNDTGDYWHWDGHQFAMESGVQTAAGYYAYYGLFETTPGDVWASNSAHRLSPGNWAPVPTDADAYSIPRVGAASPDGQVWLGGTLGRLWRYANGRFDLSVPAVDPLKLGDLYAIWSDGNGTTLAGGSILLRNTGNGWELAPHGTFGGSVNAMWGRSASDVWAVGNRAFVYHYDGTMWSPVDTGVSGALAPSFDLFAVGGTDTGEVWALGHNGQVLHFDGQAWTAGLSASVSDMHAVWVHNADDVWACGQNGIVQRWTRSGGWAQLAARPSVVTDYPTIWGTSESNVWIVSATSLAFRYDGTKWKTVPPPSDLVSGNLVTSFGIYALSGNPDGTFWASGENGYTMHWNGSALQTFTTHALEHLNGIWVGPSGEAWVVGKNGVILHHR